ncbi:MAG: tetratricopeptide repeat protein [Actinomycetota bacterium]|nr:tetratricopeptide repeat protein [Actinomycetota bacterium]
MSSARLRRLVDEIRVAEPVLASLGKVDSGAPLVDAVDILLRSLASDDRNVLLLRELALVEWQKDHNDVALALYGLADGIGGEDVDSGADKAWALIDLGRPQQAQALLTSLPASAREDRQIRSVSSWIYLRMGLPALAVDAFGDNPRSLSKSDRRERRWLWWHTGGPFWFVRRGSRRGDEDRLERWPGDAGTRSLGPADLPAVLDRVRLLNDEDRWVAHAVDLVSRGEHAEAFEALMEGGAVTSIGGALRAELAWVEASRGYEQAAVMHIQEAKELDPTGLSAVCSQIRLLTELGRFRDASVVLAGLPEVHRQAPWVRGEEAQLYRAMGLHATAFKSFGYPRVLGMEQRKNRRREWWLSGGPLGLLRRRASELDGRVLWGWRYLSQSLRLLETLPWPPGFKFASFRARVDLHHQRTALLTERWRTVWKWAVPTTVLCVFPFGIWALAERDLMAQPSTAVIGCLGAYSGGMVAGGMLGWRLSRPQVGVWPRVALPGVAVLAGAALVGVAQRLVGWPGAAGVASLAAGCMSLLTLGVIGVLVTAGKGHYQRYRRRVPREAVVADLLDILDESAIPSICNDPDRRDGWVESLYQAAEIVEKPLLGRSPRLTHHAGGSPAAERIVQAADTLRRLDRLLVATADGSWRRLTRTLRRDIVALTTGDFGTMCINKYGQSAEPIRGKDRRAGWRRWMNLLQAVVVVVMLLAAFTAVHQLLGVSGDKLVAAAVGGVALALLPLYATNPNTSYGQTIYKLVQVLLGMDGSGSFPEARRDGQWDVARDNSHEKPSKQGPAKQSKAIDAIGKVHA